MDLAGDEIKPFLQPYPLKGRRWRCQPALWALVGEVLNDGGAFGDHVAVVQLQGGDVTFGLMR